jgi:hypothetical protein
LLVVVAPVTTTVSTAPWVSVTLWVVELKEPDSKVRSKSPTFPSRRRLVKVTTPELGRTVLVPVRVAGLPASTAVLVTVIDWEWLVTTLPEESRIDSTGWVEKSVRFTKPEAWRVRATRVASPKPSVMLVGVEILDGELMLDERTLSPTVPSIRSPVKVARPEVALISLVPVSVVFAESEIV